MEKNMFCKKLVSFCFVAIFILPCNYAVSGDDNHPLGARITQPRPESMTERQKELYSEMSQGGTVTAIGPRVIYLNEPDLVKAYSVMGDYMAGIPFDPRHRELAILVVARHWDSQYEWWAHEDRARKAGLSDALIEAIRANRIPVFDKTDEKIVYDYVHEIVTSHRITDETYKKAWDLLDTEMLIKLTLLTGHYCNVAVTLNAHEVALPDGVDDPLPITDTVAVSQSSEKSNDYMLMVFLTPVEGREAEFHHWYQDEHMPEVINRPGFVSARRYAALGEEPFLPPQNSPAPQLVKYDIRTMDLEKTFSEDSRLSQEARLADPPLVPTATVSFTYQKIGQQFKGAGPKLTGEGKLKTYEFYSLCGPTPGQEEEFNIWYDTIHIPEVIATPGFVSAQRYQRSSIQRYSGAESPAYMVVYTIVTDDLESVFEVLNERHDDFIASEARDSSTSLIFIYEAISPLMERKQSSKVYEN